MPLNARQERFVQNLVAEAMNATAAYKAAGYKGQGNTAEVGASEILRNPQVKIRLAELQAEHAQRAAITVDDLVDRLERLYAIAVEDRQTGPGVQAVMGIGKLLGLIVDKAEVHENTRKPLREPMPAGAPTRMSVEEWQRRFAPQASAPQPIDPASALPPPHLMSPKRRIR